MRTSASRWTPFRGFLAALCFVVAVIGLGRSGLYGSFRLLNPVQFSEDAFLENAELYVQKLPPAETWDTWKQLQEAGLGTKLPPSELVAIRIRRRKDIEMLGWAIVGGMGLAGLVALAYLPPRDKKGGLR